jgi:hypothetical protein
MAMHLDRATDDAKGERAIRESYHARSFIGRVLNIAEDTVTG